MTRPPAARSCEGKRRYAKNKAEHVAQVMRRQGDQVHAYGCGYCGWHHIGHMGAGRRRRRGI